MSSAQLPDLVTDLGSNSVAPVIEESTPKAVVLPANFLQPKDPGDIFHINDALVERLQSANYPKIMAGKIVMIRDRHPPKLNEKLAESIRNLYNSLQIQVQPPIPVPLVD